MTKEKARNYFLNQRLQLSDSDITNLSLQIFNQWEKSNLVSFSSYHIFLPIRKKKEVNTYPFINFLWKNHKEVYCSKVDKENLLHYKLTPDTQLKENFWGIPEPSDPDSNLQIKKLDCVFVPLLAYDLSGNRAGYGKGYYDNFLKEFSDTRKIGLSFFDPVFLIENILPSDIPLDYIITPDYCSAFPIAEK